MTEAANLTKRQILTELVKSPHKQFAEYLPVGRMAAAQDPEFFAHLVAWDARKGTVRAAHVALPVVALSVSTLATADDPVLVENALAHLGELRAREFVQALGFMKEAGRRVDSADRRFVARWLAEQAALPLRESEAFALRFRHELKALYKKHHLPVPDQWRAALRPSKHEAREASVIADLRALRTADAGEVISIAHRLPFLTIRGALGQRLRTPEIMVAVIGNMSQAELATNTKLLTNLGMNDHAETKAAFEAAVQGRAKQAAPRGGTLKVAKKAKEARERGDVETAKVLEKASEVAIDTQMRKVEGRWAVLGDVSPSMVNHLPQMRMVASILARTVPEAVDLILFDTTPQRYDATGKTLSEIEEVTRRVRAGGGTSIGCGLRWLQDAKLERDGIAVVSDGEETATPHFAQAYRAYCDKIGIEPTVYLYLLRGTGQPMLRECEAAEIDVQVYDLRDDVLHGRLDDYSLANLVETMRVGRYGLLDEVRATPLLTLDAVFPRTKGMKVVHAATAASAPLLVTE